MLHFHYSDVLQEDASIQFYDEAFAQKKKMMQGAKKWCAFF